MKGFKHPKAAATPSLWAAYYQLAKPGIIYGNALPTIAGFFLASRHAVHAWLLITVLVGQSLIIAGACVFNNYLDRTIDHKMARTSSRALVAGLIKPVYALWYGGLLTLFGAITLGLGTNRLTLGIGIVGLIVYVACYGYTKRRGKLGTIVGSIAGAMPPVAGYVAVSNQLDLGATLLFILLVAWQMPHFYAIAMYRLSDYEAAGLPVLPVRRGLAVTRRRIVYYVAVYIIAVVALAATGYGGYWYLGLAGFISAWWLWQGIIGLAKLPDDKWARKMFFYSLVVLVITSSAIALNHWLP